MESPKRIANSIMGTNGSIGPVRLIPTMPPNHPHWNTATTTPYAAPMERMFMIAALSATTIDRNTTISSRNENSRTAPMNRGSRSEM